MAIEQFEDIDGWRLARILTHTVYHYTNQGEFYRDFGLRDQIRKAAGSAMHNVAEGFDSETNAEFIRFLRYAKRSCSEVQSELYVALDQKYITSEEFHETYDKARQTRAAIRGFINYLVEFEEKKPAGRIREACAEYNPEQRSINREHRTQNCEL